MKKIVLVTTLYQLRKHHACKDRYDHLVSKLGPKWGDKDKINLLDILKHNGTADCLWAFRAVTKHPEGDQVMRLMAADFAEIVLPIYEKEYPKDARPHKAIQAARDYANGKITARKRAAVGVAARAAAEEAAKTATDEAKGTAAKEAAGTVAEEFTWAAGAVARATWVATGAIWAAAWTAAGAAIWAAGAAARDAARAAAWEAAEDAAWAAAWAAAGDAAGDAARAAALDAAGDAALGAARDAQAKIIRKYLRA